MDDKITDGSNPISGISDAQSRIMDLLAPEEEKADSPEETIDESSSLDEEGEVLEDEELEGDEEFEDDDAELVDDEQAVSYTHLTLPTICSV